jgi:hypothetical protein
LQYILQTKLQKSLQAKIRKSIIILFLHDLPCKQ